MSLTSEEELRIRNIENELDKMLHKLKYAASKNMLNRLHALTEQIKDRMDTRMDEAESQLQELLELARKLQ